MKQFVFFFFIFSLLSGLIAPTANAANPPSQALKVSPVIITISLTPAKQQTFNITVENLTDKPLPLEASLNDFQTTGEEGGYVFPESQTNPLLSWITLSDKELILAPKEKKTILLTLQTPSQIPLGGYYGMLFFQPVSQTVLQTTQIIPKIGVLLLASLNVPADQQQKAELETFSTPYLIEDTNLPLLLRAKNISLHYFTAKPILTLTPLLRLANSEAKPIYLEDKLIFQGKIRRWEQTLNLNGFKPNVYKAHLALSTGNGEYVLQDKYFILFPFAKVLILLILIIVCLSLFSRRKRITKAVKILLFNK